ncbi:hypothetical protein FEM48_Zijuj07G0044200 [Ziziphus jujuba var. spinosa]|uniref:Pentatricopeptide repeat-containing protein At4g14190, chloroplastic n=1 Tax=Ziziphus jujuba var. spinosa TaxID=714518 RepID=A0A978V2F5_ZIZJJ|nr:hypothetical protein FEM48_Zijuj07G0044200 [Ziziphus jujuba var. spinosa]
MDSVLGLNHCHVKVGLPWRFNPSNKAFLCPQNPILQSPKPSYSNPKQFSLSIFSVPQHSSATHTTLLVETFHQHRSLKALLKKLSKKDSCPLQVLSEDGDWSREHFWAVIGFLKHASRFNEILQVFDMWKQIEESRINELNYNKIIKLLGEENLVEEAVKLFLEMKKYELCPSLESYNSIIHGYARKGNFDEALRFLNEMKEMNVAPETDTYEGLIEAYGKHKMYDEMGMYVKKMELNGCPPDHITYNMLIREFSRAGLLKRMERVYQTMLSKRMRLRSSTLVAMLEAYARFGILEKMEKVYMRILDSKTRLPDNLIRKLAEVYIANYMFSRLDILGVDLSSRHGGTYLAWCLRLLSHACLLSRKGMDSIIREMEEAEVSWNITIANIIMLTYLKMKDFTRLRISFSKLLTHNLMPDLVTVGILFDAKNMGFDGAETLEIWRRIGFLYKAVEMNTDPLVLTAFGKGHFLRNCEMAYSSLEPEVRGKETWTYHSLINLVFKQRGKQCQSMGEQSSQS